MPNAKDMLVRKLRLSKLERVSIPFYTEYGNSEEILPWLRYCSLSAGAMYTLLSTFRRFYVVWAFSHKHISRIQWIENVHKSLLVYLYYFQVQTRNWRQFSACSKKAKLQFFDSQIFLHLVFLAEREIKKNASQITCWLFQQPCLYAVCAEAGCSPASSVRVCLIVWTRAHPPRWQCIVFAAVPVVGMAASIGEWWFVLSLIPLQNTLRDVTW